jgi:hypothetical protein
MRASVWMTGSPPWKIGQTCELRPNTERRRCILTSLRPPAASETAESSSSVGRAPLSRRHRPQVAGLYGRVLEQVGRA